MATGTPCFERRADHQPVALAQAIEGQRKAA
jgi:hypothetical protein